MWTMKVEEFGGGMSAGNAGHAVRGYWRKDVLSLVPPLERHLTQVLYRSKLPAIGPKHVFISLPLSLAGW